MAYVDGFIIPIPKNRVDDYKKMASVGRTIWLEAGARQYVECLADDAPVGKLTSFPRSVQLADDEIVAFSWIVYDSREQRDAINAKVMSDPRFKEWENNLPFDGKRMIWGGFSPFIGL